MTVDACSLAISPSPAAAAWFIAGIFVILAVSASIYEVRRVQWVAGTAAATAVAMLPFSWTGQPGDAVRTALLTLLWLTAWPHRRCR